jgi:hypothetical protein
MKRLSVRCSVEVRLLEPEFKEPEPVLEEPTLVIFAADVPEPELKPLKLVAAA